MSNYYTPNIQLPDLKTQIANVKKLTDSVNMDNIKTINSSLTKTLNTPGMREAIDKAIKSNFQLNEIINNQLKNMNISDSLRKAMRNELKLFSATAYKKPKNTPSSQKEEVIKVRSPKVESYTDLDNSTGEIIKMGTFNIVSNESDIQIHSNDFDHIENDTSQHTNDVPNINKNPFSLTRGQENMNYFFFNLNETMIKIYVNINFPKLLNGTYDAFTFFMMIFLSTVIAFCTKNFDKDKYNNNI